MRGEDIAINRFVVGQPYSRVDIAETGRVEPPQSPRDPHWSTGIVTFDNAVVLLVTLEKTEFTYIDHFEGALFWWQSQNRQTQDSRTIMEIASGDFDVLLFVRIRAKDRSETMPFIYCGRLASPVMTGERPVTAVFAAVDYVPRATGELAQIYKWRPRGGLRREEGKARREAVRSRLNLPETVDSAPLAPDGGPPVSKRRNPFANMMPVDGPLPSPSALRRQVQMQQGLSEPAVEVGVEIEPDELIDEDLSSAQGRQADPKLRKEIELYAMRWATNYYRRLGWSIEDTSAHKPYDLLCTNGAQQLRVEVKGTQSLGERVSVTRGEVDSARQAKTDLFIVYGITVERREPLQLSGGAIRRIEDWYPEDAQLSPTAFIFNALDVE